MKVQFLLLKKQEILFPLDNIMPGTLQDDRMMINCDHKLQASSFIALCDIISASDVQD